MTPRKRALRKDAERNRRRVLEGARELFGQHGLGVSLSDIAHHVGLGVGTVYRRFPDKAELIEELFILRAQAVLELAQQAAEAADPWVGLTGFLEGALGLQADDRGFNEIVLGAPSPLRRLHELSMRMLQFTTILVERAHAVGKLRPDFTAQDIPFVMLTVGTVIGAARNVEPELWRRYLALAIDGMRAEGSMPSSLPTRALDPDEVERVLSSWQPPRR